MIQAIVQKYILSAVKRGFSANATLELLKGRGLSYRRIDFLADFRNLANIPAKANRMKFIRDSFRVSDELYTTPTGYMKNKYRYVVKVRVYKPETNETFEMYTSTAGSKELTIGKVKDIAFENVNPSMETSNFEIKSVVVEEAYKRPPLTFK